VIKSNEEFAKVVADVFLNLVIIEEIVESEIISDYVAQGDIVRYRLKKQ